MNLDSVASSDRVVSLDLTMIEPEVLSESISKSLEIVDKYIPELMTVDNINAVNTGVQIMGKSLFDNKTCSIYFHENYVYFIGTKDDFMFRDLSILDSEINIYLKHIKEVVFFSGKDKKDKKAKDKTKLSQDDEGKIVDYTPKSKDKSKNKFKLQSIKSSYKDEAFNSIEVPVSIANSHEMNTYRNNNNDKHTNRNNSSHTKHIYNKGEIKNLVSMALSNPSTLPKLPYSLYQMLLKLKNMSDRGILSDKDRDMDTVYTNLLKIANR